MLYTVIIKKRVIVEADCADEAQELAENGESIVDYEEILGIRPTTQSEKIYFDLTYPNITKENLL